MNIDVASILKAIGPGASIIFAAWIFVGFVQTRYDAAADRFRSMIDQYRSAELSDTRRKNLRDQIGVVKRRCELMHFANRTGLLSAMFLVLTLITAMFGMVFTNVAALVYISTATMLCGFILVIVAACFVFVESSIVRRQMNAELLDIPDLADRTGQAAGDITEQQPAPDIGARLSHTISGKG